MSTSLEVDTSWNRNLVGENAQCQGLVESFVGPGAHVVQALCPEQLSEKRQEGRSGLLFADFSSKRISAFQSQIAKCIVTG